MAMGWLKEGLEGKEVERAKHPFAIFDAAAKIFYGVTVLVLRDLC